MVFVTKYRHRVLTSAHLDTCEEIIQETLGTLGADLQRFNGEADHVHSTEQLDDDEGRA